MPEVFLCAFAPLRGKSLFCSSRPCGSLLYAQLKPTDYTRTEAMIPMRDGVRLYTQIDAPANVTERLPILLLRTPYGLGALKPDQIATLLSELSEAATSSSARTFAGVSSLKASL